MNPLDEDEVKAAFLARRLLHADSEDTIESMSRVLFERFDDRQLGEYFRLLGSIVHDDGVQEFSPERMFSVAATAVFLAGQEEA